MADLLALAGQSLLIPMILSFALARFAALTRPDLTIPEAMAKAMSIYLLFAIGFKGGVAVAEHGFALALIATLMAGIALSFGLPFVAFGLLRLRWPRWPPLMPPQSPPTTARSPSSPSLRQLRFWKGRALQAKVTWCQ